MGQENNSKVFVEVTAFFKQDGTIIPLSIIWEDGRKYDIDKVQDIRKAASTKAGGIGMRYTVRIKNKVAFLYHDEKQWFMERK